MTLFKSKPFDIQPVVSEWKASVFTGKPKPELEGWLLEIKGGCRERNVPKDSWVPISQHYMAQKAKDRLEEVRRVMEQVQSKTFKWNWKKFKIAMRNIQWCDKCRKGKCSASNTVAKLSASDSFSIKGKEFSADSKTPVVHTHDNMSLPDWLLGFKDAFDHVFQANPNTTAAVSALLMALGTIPALPLAGTAAGGTILTSGAVQAAGTVAMAVGTWLGGKQQQPAEPPLAIKAAKK